MDDYSIRKAILERPTFLDCLMPCGKEFSENTEEGDRIFVPNYTAIVCEAMARDGLLLRFVRYTNTDIILTAVKQNGNALKYIHPAEQTREIVEAAVLTTPSAEQYVYPSISNRPIQLKTLDKN